MIIIMMMAIPGDDDIAPAIPVDFFPCYRDYARVDWEPPSMPASRLMAGFSFFVAALVAVLSRHGAAVLLRSCSPAFSVLLVGLDWSSIVVNLLVVLMMFAGDVGISYFRSTSQINRELNLILL